MDKSKSEVRTEKSNAMERALIKLHKINLIYELKLKSNDIGRRIGRETHNLT